MTPDELMIKFGEGLRGESDVDMMEVLHAIIADVADTVLLACTYRTSRLVDYLPEIRLEIDDYVVNHYGDD